MKPRTSTLHVEGIDLDVVRKDVKHVRISVHPPDGRVRVSAPRHVNDASLHRALAPRMAWVRRKQAEIARRVLPPEPQFVTGEEHRIFGERYRLEVREGGRPHGVALSGDGRLLLQVPPGATAERRAAIFERWQREQLLGAIPALLAEWQPRLGVSAAEVRVRRMTTRWGSCNTKARRIWLNLALAAHDEACLEYVIVHELMHLLEPSHGPRFWRLMDEHLPTWRSRREALKRMR